MPPKDAETIAKWYDALSKNYDDLYGEEQSKKHARVLRLLGNREFEIFVDVGCGTGKLLELMASRSQVAIGLDLSVEMLIRAKQRSTGNVIQLVRADASHIPLQDQIADGVTSVSMTESGPSLEEHSSELARIATNDATLIMTIFDIESQNSPKQTNETNIELVTALSNREKLYVLDKTKYRTRASSESTALV